jgi:hypothetical protein
MPATSLNWSNPLRRKHHVGATLLKKGDPFADSAGRSSATIHDWDTRGGLRNPQKGNKKV